MLGLILYFIFCLMAFAWIWVVGIDVCEQDDVSQSFVTRRMTVSDFKILVVFPTIILYVIAWIMRVLF